MVQQNKLLIYHRKLLDRKGHVIEGCIIIGYEPADLTVHPPPPRTAEGGFIFFV